VGPFATVTADVSTSCQGYGCSPTTTPKVGVHVLLAGSRIATVRAPPLGSPADPAGDVLYYHWDQRGSVIATTLSGGRVGVKYRYGPYGQLARLEGVDWGGESELGYTGGLRLGWTPGSQLGSLLLLGARVYHPEMRRWVQPDTVDLLRFTYAGGDPVGFSDPSGRLPVSDSAMHWKLASMQPAQLAAFQEDLAWLARNASSPFNFDRLVELVGLEEATRLALAASKENLSEQELNLYGITVVELGTERGVSATLYVGPNFSIIRFSDGYADVIPTTVIDLDDTSGRVSYPMDPLDFLPGPRVAAGIGVGAKGLLSALRNLPRLLAPRAARGAARAINVTEKGLAHVLERHVAGGALATGNKSIFAAGENLPALIRGAGSVAPTVQSTGRLAYTVDAGRIIGIDRATGAGTSVYTVITEATGELVTAFPGIPLAP
jgi:RHS repeat-associated protein